MFCGFSEMHCFLCNSFRSYPNLSEPHTTHFWASAPLTRPTSWLSTPCERALHKTSGKHAREGLRTSLQDLYPDLFFQNTKPSLPHWHTISALRQVRHLRWRQHSFLLLGPADAVHVAEDFKQAFLLIERRPIGQYGAA